jgi:isopenicillin N synthase-like dioxygenase
VSTPHRVRAQTEEGRLSFPLFFDPNFTAEMRPLPLVGKDGSDAGPAVERWDEADLHQFEGTYGDYLLSKVSKVFPELGTEVL